MLRTATSISRPSSRICLLGLLFGSLMGSCTVEPRTPCANDCSELKNAAPGQPLASSTEHPIPDVEQPSPAATVRSLSEAEKRLSPSGTASIMLLAQGSQAFVGRLQMEGGAAVPEHKDTTEEYIHILQGQGTMTIDGQSFDIAEGATIFMPANATVSFQNGPETLIALQVFAGPQPAQKYDRWNPQP